MALARSLNGMRSLGLFGWVATLGVAAASAYAADMEISECKLGAQDGLHEVDALCGRLTVPLDRRDPSGRAIDLFVAVVEASAESVNPDPLMILAGGPGDAATRFFVVGGSAFARILRTRNVVLVDQRGTGRSAPLRCGSSRYDAYLAGHDARAATEVGIACLNELAHDPRFFTTSATVADLEHVRIALGYEQLNLYAFSYGTRVALHYLRRHPERVRSVILDGALPLDLPLGPDLAVTSQTALNALFARCAADTACRVAFPRIERRFRTVRERLSTAPAQVTLDDPRTGEEIKLVLNRVLFARVVRLLLATSRGASLVPVLIDAAHAGDYRGLAAQALLFAEDRKDLAAGLEYAVLCAEDAPYYEDTDPAARADTFAGSTLVDIVAGVCAHWPGGSVDDDLRDPVAGGTPVLALSGEFDPVAPPRIARRAVGRLSEVVHVVGRERAHDMLLTRCAQRVMAAFVESADPDSLDLGCVDRIRGHPLFTSPMGPGP